MSRDVSNSQDVLEGLEDLWLGMTFFGVAMVGAAVVIISATVLRMQMSPGRSRIAKP